MSKINKIKVLDNEKIDLGSGFEIMISRRVEIYDSPSSSGFTEREIQPLFRGLIFRRHMIPGSMLLVLDLIEILRGFCSNRMISEKIYYVPHSSSSYPLDFVLTCQTRPHKGHVYLFIFRGERKTNVLLDKIECAQLATKMTKVINACVYPAPS